ncbi:hypothetical protein ACHAXN_003658 [Cyclotella atomus]
MASIQPSLLLTLLLSLLLSCTTLASPSTKKRHEEYESKLANALTHYASHIGSVTTSSHQALLEEDGTMHELEFAAMAIANEMNRLSLIRYRLGLDDDEEEDEEDASEPNSQLDTADIEKEAMIKDSLDPEEWYAYSYWELHAYFSCAAEFIKSKPIPTPERWNDLRSFYHEFVKQDLQDWPLQNENEPRSYIYTDVSYDPPMEPFQSGFKGRGLKANRRIEKGELVFRATNNTIIFTHGHTWRKFLFALYERHGEEEHQLDSETTCDVLVWSWIQRLVPRGPLVIVMDLDNGSLMNEGREDEGWEDPNVKCGKEDWCDFEYYAIKDIEVGEEILCDYREFAMLNAWVDMGL